MEQIFILGATGNIGTEVLRALKSKSVKVFAGVQSESKFDKVLEFGATPIIVNFENQESLNAALKGKDRVFLVTPMMQNPETITQNVINAVKLNGIKHFVRSTAAGADSKNSVQMLRWAGASEDLLRNSDINYTIVRPATFLQNFINFMAYTIKTQNTFYASFGNAKLSYLDLMDFGNVVSEILTSENHFGKSYNFSGSTYTMLDLSETLSSVLNRKISYVDTPEEMTEKAMLDMHIPDWMVNAMMELYSYTKQGLTDAFSEDFRTITGKDYTNAKSFFDRNKMLF
jgi:uncharacterized protein YbjT (DUF2867 family)